MSEPKKNEPQIFPQPYPSAACDIFNCRSRAKWFIGKPQPSSTWNLCLKLCDECAKKILSTIPEELRQYIHAQPEPEKAAGADEAAGTDEAAGADEALEAKLHAALAENERLAAKVKGLEAKLKEAVAKKGVRR